MSLPAPEFGLADLNDAQRQAVTTTEGPLLVVAGAGSGKTRVLTYRVAHLLAACGVEPNEILAITFTNKAAEEMRRRIGETVGWSRARGIWILTFHATCGRILRREGERLGYRPNFTIYDQADQVRLVRQCLEELGRDPKRFPPRSVHTQISNAKNLLIGPDEYAVRVAGFADRIVADVYELYQKRLFRLNAVDFDDLLMLTVELFERFPEVRERWARTFRYVMVDEYQDTNHAQYSLLNQLASVYGNLMVVGDPDQSIYAFRGADIRNILEFERDFPGARTIALEQNYRSTNRILTAANAVISHNRERKEKELWSELGDGDPVSVVETEDEHAEARHVATAVARLVEDEGRSLGEVAVIYRTNAQSRVLEDVLVRAGFDYQVLGGVKFYERAEIRDAIAYLRVIDNPTDSVSLERIANSPRRGVGDTSLDRLRAFASTEGISLWGAIERAEEVGLASASLRAVARLRALLQSLMAQALELSIGELIERIVERTEYEQSLLAALPRWEAEGKIENLAELAGVAREYTDNDPGATLSSFLQEISLYSDQDALRGAESGGQLTLMTAHNAKGLEFPVVFMLGMEETIFPHLRSVEENSIEEERRLCYVGMTRAKERLTMLHASRRSLYGRSDANLPSRFLDELPGELIDRVRLVPSSWSNYGAPAAHYGAPATNAAVARPARPIPELSTGDTVRHDTLGTGIVTRIEADGVVTVRFEDRSERRLVLEYARLEKVS